MSEIEKMATIELHISEICLVLFYLQQRYTILEGCSSYRVRSHR